MRSLFAFLLLLSTAQAAAPPAGYTPGSLVYEMGPGYDTVHSTGSGYYHAGLEAILLPGYSYHDFPFHVTPGTKLYSLQGTSQWDTQCTGEYLAVVEIDGFKMPINDRVDSSKSLGNSTLFINYHFNGMPLTTGVGNIHIRATVNCNGAGVNGTNLPPEGAYGSWELQAVIEAR
jgi:hypothetical protein